MAETIGARHENGALVLAEGFARAEKRARAKGLAHSTTVALVDGLAGTGEKLIAELLRATRPYLQVVGGAAADEGAFKSTFVGSSRRAVAADAAVVAHCFGPKAWGVGGGHGLRGSTAKMKVTQATGNVIARIDGRPAFEAYREHARVRGIELTMKDAPQYIIANELGVYFLDRI